MSTTTYSNLRYPQSSDSPNIGQYFQNLANDVDQKVIVSVASPTARAALSAKFDGMLVYEQSTKRYYRWDTTAGGAWLYAGGNPPPIVAVTVAGGWAAGANFAPGCYKDASGLVHVLGGVTNGQAYTPAGITAMFLPAGFWPTRDIAVQVSVPAGAGIVIGGVYAADGSIKFNYNNGASIGPGILHTVNFSFHPTFAGGALS